MIDVRAQAEFRADFPDDGIEGKSGWIEFPGRGVATSIAEMLEGIGCAVAGPKHAHEHGWELMIQFKQESLWCQVSSLGEDYVLLFLEGHFMGNSSRSPSYLEAITRLNLEMQRDPRFHDVRWRHSRGPEGPSSSTPLDIGLDQLPEPTPKLQWSQWFRWFLADVFGRNGVTKG
jgi:hypothetical protein